MASPNYSKIVRKVKLRMDPTLKIQGNALELLSSICGELNVTLVNECKKDYRSSKNTVMTDENAENAVENVFRAKLKRFAKNSGKSAVSNYVNKVIYYNEGKAVAHQDDVKIPQKKTPKAKSKPKDPGENFVHGIQGILNKMGNDFSQFSVNTKAKKEVGKKIYNLAQKLAKLAADNTKETMDRQSIQNILPKILPENMKQHAHAEAEIAVGHHKHGLLNFHPRKKQPEVDLAAERRKMSASIKHFGNAPFKTGVNRLLSTSSSGHKMEAKAERRVDTYMTQFAKKLAIDASILASSMNILTQKEIRNAMLAIGPPSDLKKGAEAEGNRVLTLFENGEITFKPRQMTTVRKERKTKPVSKRTTKRQKSGSKKSKNRNVSRPRLPRLTNVNFDKAIDVTAAVIHPGVVLSKAAYDKLNAILLKLTTNMCLSSDHGTGQMKPQCVLKILKTKFPKSLCDHALTHYSKCLANQATNIAGKGGKSSFMIEAFESVSELSGNESMTSSMIEDEKEEKSELDKTDNDTEEI